MKKKVVIISSAVVVTCLVIGGIVFAITKSKKKDTSNAVNVDPVSKFIADANANGKTNRYTGIVESQKTYNVEKDDTKVVKEILVSVGDTVEVGTPLFSYDTDEISLNISQVKLELEQCANNIESYNNQISELQKEKDAASEDQKAVYSAQISQTQVSVRQEQYTQKTKQLELERLQSSLDNATVTATSAGVIQTINNNSSNDYYGSGQQAFMTILSDGGYKIKGTISEQDALSVSNMVGYKMIVRSRVDESILWTGSLEKVDTSNPENNNNDMYYSDTNNDNSAAKYPFYVKLDSSEGLMLGQHVYIEFDNGQSVEKSGIWLDSWYLVKKDGNYYVWTANSKDKLELRKVTLGEYDDKLDQYEITDGLKESDYIAFPDGALKEGSSVKYNKISE